MSVDLPLYDYQVFLNANKSKEYQERVHLRTKILVDFLSKNNLLVNLSPYDENGNVKLDLIIYESNVTPEGDKLFMKTIPNWYKAHDRGTPIEKISILERGLKKIRESKLL
ncbi:DNA polymerase III [Pelistega ratti]|uniref:DNA polymerase III n=1 Tax=Pelistega ratti TaxID=2652177 RepID=UPI00135674B4|nr:DNA polymerase III [Pelistega ratti]